MAYDYTWMDWPHVEITYERGHSAACKEFVPTGRYHRLPVMDTSKVGMCFWYYFEDAEDLKNFEQNVKDERPQNV
jgi:hypothetical protein